jgi:23S rRNA (adenine2030-N6)-methyltransferase
MVPLERAPSPGEQPAACEVYAYHSCLPFYDCAMLSYRHAYHAGNHADVLKHLVLMLCLEHMNAKDKPYQVVDTHAGAGVYGLDSASAQRTGEYLDGIARLWRAQDQRSTQATPFPAAVQRLLDLIRTLNPTGGLHKYPGSPWITQAMIRPGDKLRLCELHSTDYALLVRNFGEGNKHTLVDHADGFDVLKAALPPLSRRGLVLIDPSYEMKSDYAKVVAAMKDALTRFATGTYLIWHPMLPLLDANALPDRLKKLPARHWVHATIQVRAPSTKGHGMHGSGMVVINPPWTLAATLREVLPVIAPLLAQSEDASWDVSEVEAKPGVAP